MTALRALSCLLLLLSLTEAAPAAPQATPKDNPAVAAVRQFLADRTAGKLDAAYGLLSASSRQMNTQAEFAKGNPPTFSDTRGLSAAFVGAVALFLDTHNTLHDTFTILGPDPAAPGGVLVRTASPAGTTTLLRIATVIDPGASAPRLDILGSLKHTDPKGFVQARDKARLTASQSNMKQLSLGIIQYAFDHDNHLPDADKWVDELQPYVQNIKALLRDPSAPAGEEYSYAFNRALAGATLNTSPSPGNTIASVQLRDDGRKVEAPSTVLLFESTAGTKNASDMGQSVPKPGRHLGGTDYAFADGHVRWLPDGTAPSFALTGKPEAP